MIHQKSDKKETGQALNENVLSKWRYSSAGFGKTIFSRIAAPFSFRA